jgi:hypothetical protein
MPSNLIKHDVKEGKGSKKTLEKKWDRAKKIAKKGAKNPKDSWALTTYIYEKMRDSKKGKKKSKASVTASILTASVQPVKNVRSFQVHAASRLDLHNFVLANKDALQRYNEKAEKDPNTHGYSSHRGVHEDFDDVKEVDYESDATTEVEADAFEGWINTLKYTYDRPEGADYVVVDATYDEVTHKLQSEDWHQNGKNFSKGQHEVEVEKAGDDKTKITSIK